MTARELQFELQVQLSLLRLLAFAGGDRRPSLPGLGEQQAPVNRPKR